MSSYLPHSFQLPLPPGVGSSFGLQPGHAALYSSSLVWRWAPPQLRELCNIITRLNLIRGELSNDLNYKCPTSLPWLSVVTPISLAAHSAVWKSLLRPDTIPLYPERVLRSCKAEVYWLWGGTICWVLGKSVGSTVLVFSFQGLGANQRSPSGCNRKQYFSGEAVVFFVA